MGRALGLSVKTKIQERTLPKSNVSEDIRGDM